MPVLVVNVDHIATIRQARMGVEPDPVTGAHLAEMAGARGIIVHLREDRRHIQDRDVQLLRETLKTNLHFEMAATGEMQRIALKTKPYMVCLVPEKREELTTEGGLDCVGREKILSDFLTPFHESGVRSSLFIDADPRQIDAAARAGAEYVEIHTGHYADAAGHKERQQELEKIVSGIRHAQGLGLKVNLGHGLNYHNIFGFSKVSGIHEFSIGHSIISRAVFTGMAEAVKAMSDIIQNFVE
ncbi:pyridoxine 5'-phosphate synthase [Desulfonatronovibrio hydrogenovorans]|uniref:pyridoxine 5'-phosphate synthase n=1 Tax=Desulfonatronovibrio hydrogenovorans TaxID=53245 RepID=UPI00048F1B80|nr:pyridoxine 5'-phosphate synthase [Desulfonatronovibrio hydrogenovorans]